MNPQITTKELEDGTYLHTYQVQTYFLNESIVSPVAIKNISSEPPPQLFGGPSLGQYEPWKLSQFLQVKDVMVEKGQLVELAHVENNKLVIHPNALDVFRRYPSNEISFVGNYGRLNSGKSFWYDKILNLSQIDGHGYEANVSKQGIYFWSIPFTKGNLKFFLLDFVGFQGKEKLSKADEVLLDLELLLAQKFVVMPEPEDQNLTILPIAYNHLLQSQKRFTDKGVVANKFSPYWPNQIYTLYRSTRPVRKQIDNIGILFEVYNFSILHDAMNPRAQGSKVDLQKSTVRDPNEAAPLNEKYVRMTSIVFQDIYEKMKGKKYGGITFRGDNISTILEQAQVTINNGQGVKVDQIFKGVRTNISDDTLVKAKELFIKQVEPIRADPRPRPVDDIIDSFEKGNNAAFAYLDSVPMTKQDNYIIENRLRYEIDLLQQQILEQNKRKTYIHYSQTLVPIPANDTQQAYTSLKSSYISQKQKNKLDHNDTVIVARQLKSIAQPANTSLGIGQNAVIMSLKKTIDDKKKELEDIKNKKMNNPETIVLKPQNHKMAQTRDILQSKTIQLKSALSDEKKLLEMDPNNKKNELEILRSKHAQNEVYRSKLAQGGEPHPQVLKLEDAIRKIVTKNRQYEGGIQNLEKSFMTSRSNRSQIRDVKDQSIKKVSVLK